MRFEEFATAFTGPPRTAEPVAIMSGNDFGAVLRVTVTDRDDYWTDTARPAQTGRFTLDGRPAWYQNEDTGGSQLVVELPRCVLWINSADRRRLTRADFVHVATATDVERCGTGGR